MAAPPVAAPSAAVAALPLRLRCSPSRRRPPRAAPPAASRARRPRGTTVGPIARRLALRLGLSAFRIFSGVTGISSTRTPTASNTALATAGMIGSSGPWPTSLAPNGPSGSRILDQVGEDLRHVEAGRALVLEHRRELVHQRVREARRQPPERLLLHQRLAEAHVDAALDLAAHQHRIERLADVVGDPHPRHRRSSRSRDRPRPRRPPRCRSRSARVRRRRP